MIARPYQQTAVDSAFTEWQTNHSTLVVMPTGCHDPKQPIMLASGLVFPADTIMPGTRLMGMDGKPRRVLKVHRGKNEMVRVTPVKGDPFVVTLNHPLTLVATRHKNGAKFPSQDRDGQIIDVPVFEWLQWSKTKKHIHKLFRVPCEFPFDDTAEDYPAAYLIGVMLGDGGFRASMGITTADPEIVKECNRLLAPHALYLKPAEKKSAATTYLLRAKTQKWAHTPSLFRKWLKLLKLNGTHSGNKHIPSIYRLGSREQRLEVLAGLIDTDGSRDGGGYDYVSKSRQLANDVAFVARSLGLAAYVKPCRKGCQTGAIGDYHRVTISGDCAIVPCRIKRKRCTKRRQKKNVLRTGFTVERIGVGDFVGFTVDGDNRYVMGDFTVTHNTGKTVVFSKIIKRMHELGKRSMVLVHREELAFQARKTIEKSTGLDCEIEMADLRAETSLFHSSPVVISTIQTQTAGKDGRMTRFDPRHFGLVILDEAHHCVAESWMRTIEYYCAGNPDLKVLGVTATPDRADELALGKAFGSVAFVYELLEAIRDGWLVPIKQQMVNVEGLDFSHIRTTAGDLNGGDLAAIMEAEGPLQGIASASIDIIGDRRTLVFAASVKHAEMLCEIYNRHRSEMAHWVCGKTPKEDRRQKLQDFSDGTTQVMVNVGVLTEGFDNPGVQCIIQGRPTKSRSLYSQMVGRATRPLPGLVDGLDLAADRLAAIAQSAKPHCLVVDFVGNTGRHKLITSADILGGKSTDEAIELARERVKKKGGAQDMRSEIEQAEADIAEQKRLAEEARQREAARKAHLVAKVKYTSQSVDPFDVFELQPERERGWDSGHKLSVKQLEMLEKNGIKDAAEMPFHQAKQLLNEMFRRFDTGEASFKQCRKLKEYGYETKGLTRDAASKLMDALARNGWKRPDAVPSALPAAAAVASDGDDNIPF